MKDYLKFAGKAVAGIYVLAIAKRLLENAAKEERELFNSSDK